MNKFKNSQFKNSPVLFIIFTALFAAVNLIQLWTGLVDSWNPSGVLVAGAAGSIIAPFFFKGV